MSLVVRNRPYAGSYFSPLDSQEQQIIDSIISELQDTGSIRERGCYVPVPTMTIITNLLNASPLFNTQYIMSFTENIDDFGRNRCLTVFTKL